MNHVNLKNSSIEDVDALILCGGLGSRLSSLIPDRPKGLALIGGKPFMDMLLEDLLKHGIRRVIFCVGHLKEQIISRYKNRNDAEYLFSQEEVPLGTGGAIVNALPLIRSDTFLVMNGDSLCNVEFDKFLRFHLTKRATASFVLTRADERSDGGLVSIDESQKVQIFLEKTPIKAQNDSYINSGIYLLQKKSIYFKNRPTSFSLEYDIFPDLVRTKLCFGFVVEGSLVDIGTPERYLKANENYC